jgi:glycosyltransferase involved in cell wall biosynthesis
VESIVVDDGSTDDTAAVLARYADDPRVTVIRQENAGQTVAKNRGLAAARGDVIGFCDADDVWRPGKLAAQLPRFAAPGVGVVYGDFQFIDGDGAPIDTVRPRVYEGRVSGRLLADNFVHVPTALVRREAIDAAGGFDAALTMGIDWDLWLRLSVDWDFVYVPEILVDYRIWAGQMSHRTGERLDNALRIMDRFIADHPESIRPAERRNAWAHTYVSRALWHAHEGRRNEAWADLRRAFAERPWDRRLWREGLSLLFR